ncbi:MAG: hypothetical protein C4326_14865 [Ignavibacteria bacterium]
MRAYLYIACVAVLLLPLACAKEKPKVRVENRRAELIDVQLKRQQGSTINFNDVGGGATTGFVEVDRATYELDVKVEGLSTDATTFFTAEEDKQYGVVVPKTTPPSVRIEMR